LLLPAHVLTHASYQIREELVYHNIRLYPFDTDEDDEEEVLVNENIRVSYRLSFH
jgi:septin family protein